MSNILDTTQTDKERLIRLDLHGRPSLTFAAGEPPPGMWADLCLHTADGTAEIVICPTQADYDAAKALDGTTTFFRVPRQILVGKFPSTVSLFT